MVVLLVLSVIVWLSIPPVLSRAMTHRGYDGGSWQVIGLLFGPVGVALAALEVLFDVSERPRILERGLNGVGDVSILVVLEEDSPTVRPTAALAELSPNLRRLGLAQILPRGGPRLDERRAERSLRRAAIGLDHPEIALLFGRADLVIADFAAAGGYDVVVTEHPDSLVSAQLAAVDRVHWWGDEDMPVFGPGRVTAAPSWPAGTESRAPAPAASVRPLRRLDDDRPESPVRAALR